VGLPGKIPRQQSKFTLFDKVVGLAAARLMVYSGIIEAVITPLVSQPAKQFLEENGVRISADEVVAHILRKDKSAICPGEIMAMGTDNRDDYLARVKAMLPHSTALDKKEETHVRLPVSL